MKKMWSGRFSEDSSELLEEFNASINFDKRMYFQDIRGSIAHSSMLASCDIISAEDALSIKSGLEQILNEIQSGEFKWHIADEDIHMAIEKRLGEIIGTEIAGRLHTARSRNDQVALDFRMYIQESNLIISELLKDLIKTLYNIADKNTDTLMPGYTHLQHAQPISLAYHLCAYIFMFIRDVSRLNDSMARANLCPLGSAAMAGTPHNIDRNLTSDLLGFNAPTLNAMDSVSDRDFALEMLFNISVIFMHTSRLCEELILWCSQEFGFLCMSDSYSTGSSIMPQKKNPDVAELIRGKTGRVYGNLISLLTVMKALPLAYNKDMQEDKECVFDSIDTAISSLKILNHMIQSTKFNKDNMLLATQKGHLSATDLADFLVKKCHVPFRKAHYITGKAVALAEEIGVDLSQLSQEDLSKVDELLNSPEAVKALNLKDSMESRNSIGGTSTDAVAKQLEYIKRWLNNSK